MSFALDTPVSKLCFYSIQCTRQKVEKLSAHFLCLLISLGTWSLMRQSSSLMARRHITGMLFTARIYFINHCRWNELLWNPNIYIQTKPNPSADCSWVISQRFWKQKARIICVFLPMSSQDLKGMAVLSTTLFESQAARRSLTSPSTLLFRLGLWHLCFYWSCPKHSTDSSFTPSYCSQCAHSRQLLTDDESKWVKWDRAFEQLMDTGAAGLKDPVS